MIRIALVIALLGCSKKSEPPPAPAPEPPPAPVADDGAFKRLLDNTLDYTYSMIPMLASFDGDCTAQIERMKKIEPLVQKIRDDQAKAPPDFDSKIREYMREHKVEVAAKIETQLAAAKITREGLEAKDADLKAKCGTNPAYVEEMNRIGVMKKKTP